MYVRTRFLLIFVILSAAIASCGGPPSITPPDSSLEGVRPSWETLDSFDYNVAEADFGFVFPAAHLYERLYFSRAAAEGGIVSDSAIQFFRDSILIDTLIGLTVADYNLAAHWHNYREYRTRTNNALRQSFWDQEVSSKVVIDSQAVIDYYHDNPEKFALPEQVDVYHILSSPLGFRQGPDSAQVGHYTRADLTVFAEQYIYRLYRLLQYGEAFENVAFNYSHDVLSREQGGHLGWTTRERYVDPFDSVAFSLEDGEFSEPYEDGDGWHIVYRARYNPGGTQSLDTSWVYVGCQQAVFDATASQMGARILDSLMQSMEITVNESVLTDSLIYSIDDSVWAAAVNETDTIDVLTLKGMEENYRRGYSVSSTTPEMRRNMITQAATGVRVIQAARDKGMDTLSEHVEIMKRVWRETVKSIRLADLYSRDSWEPSDSTMRAYYQEHFARYNPENHIKAQQLIVQDMELANFLREQANLGLDLEYLSKYYGEEEGYKVEYEDLGTVSRGSVDSDLYLALERTHAPNMTRVVKTDRGFHLARVIDRGYDRPYEMVLSEIRSHFKELHRWQRWAGIRDELFRQHHVRFPADLPSFELPRLSLRDHPRTLPKQVNVGR